MDETENIRRTMVAEINSNPNDRELLSQKYGQIWDTSEMSKDFEVLGFMAPYVVVVRQVDGVKGTLMFQHNPRFYFNFREA